MITGIIQDYQVIWQWAYRALSWWSWSFLLLSMTFYGSHKRLQHKFDSPHQRLRVLPFNSSLLKLRSIHLLVIQSSFGNAVIVDHYTKTMIPTKGAPFKRFSMVKRFAYRITHHFILFQFHSTQSHYTIVPIPIYQITYLLRN